MNQGEGRQSAEVSGKTWPVRPVEGAQTDDGTVGVSFGGVVSPVKSWGISHSLGPVDDDGYKGMLKATWTIQEAYIVG